MKFILKGYKEKHTGDLMRWVLVFPHSFGVKRVGAHFNPSTGKLHVYSDPDEGCSVSPRPNGFKRVQLSSKKWLPNLGGDKIEPIEVEWFHGECTAQIRPPVKTLVAPLPDMTKDKSVVKKALEILNDYVADPNQNAEFDISEQGRLRIKVTEVRWL